MLESARTRRYKFSSLDVRLTWVIKTKIHSRRNFLWEKMFKFSDSWLKNHLPYKNFSNVGYLSATIDKPPFAPHPGRGILSSPYTKPSRKTASSVYAIHLRNPEPYSLENVSWDQLRPLAVLCIQSRLARVDVCIIGRDPVGSLKYLPEGIEPKEDWYSNIGSKEVWRIC